MNSNLIVRRFLMLSALALALPAGSAMAQPGGMGRGHQQCGSSEMARETGQGRMFGPMLRQLGLNAEQQKQLRLQRDAEQDANRTLMRELREERIALHELTAADQYDAKKAAEISERIGRLHGKLALSMAEGQRKMLALLTPEQRARIKDMPVRPHHGKH